MWDDTRKRLAKQLFGRALRLALAEWVLKQGGSAFYQQEAQIAMLAQGEASSATAVELRRLVSHGMLAEFRENARVYYVEQPSPFWSAFRAMSDSLDRAQTSGTNSPTRTHLRPR